MSDQLKPRGSRILSRVLETPSAAPGVAKSHFRARLEVETDPSDVYVDLRNGENGFLLVDVRSKEAFSESHIPGAINMPYREINTSRVAHLSKDKLIVVYCFSPACNAATKAALRLAELGFFVKEMIGGIEYWQHEGYPVATSDQPEVELSAPVLG